MPNNSGRAGERCAHGFMGLANSIRTASRVQVDAPPPRPIASHLIDYPSDTSADLGITAAIGVTVLEIIIFSRQPAQRKPIEEVSACLPYRTPRLQSDVCRARCELVLLRDVQERHALPAIGPD